MKQSGLPVRRYAVTLSLSAAGFMALSILDQRELFFPAFGLATVAPASRPTAPDAAPAEAEAVVRRFNTAMEAAYGSGSPAPLSGLPISPALEARLVEELSNTAAREASAGLSLADFEVLRIEPRGQRGWEVTTDETWVAGGRRSRLRFRYDLSAQGTNLRLNEATPLLPEPVRESSR